MFLWLVGFAILLLLIISPQEIKQTLFTTEQLPVAGQVRVLAPGHGGPDGGAVAKDKEKTTERVISLEAANMTRQCQDQAGTIVYLTRQTVVALADEFTKGI